MLYVICAQALETSNAAGFVECCYVICHPEAVLWRDEYSNLEIYILKINRNSVHVINLSLKFSWDFVPMVIRYKRVWIVSISLPFKCTECG